MVGALVRMAQGVARVVGGAVEARLVGRGADGAMPEPAASAWGRGLGEGPRRGGEEEGRRRVVVFVGRHRLISHEASFERLVGGAPPVATGPRFFSFSALHVAQNAPGVSLFRPERRRVFANPATLSGSAESAAVRSSPERGLSDPRREHALTPPIRGIVYGATGSFRRPASRS